MDKKRTAPVQTRIDYRTLCSLVENAPSEAAGEGHSISAVLRFYLEAFEESLIDKGYERALDIEDAIARIELLGFSLGNLHNESREARATRLAIQKDRMKNLLDIKKTNKEETKQSKDEEDEFIKLAEKAAKEMKA